MLDWEGMRPGRQPKAGENVTGAWHAAGHWMWPDILEVQQRKLSPYLRTFAARIPQQSTYWSVQNANISLSMLAKPQGASWTEAGITSMPLTRVTFKDPPVGRCIDTSPQITTHQETSGYLPLRRFMVMQLLCQSENSTGSGSLTLSDQDSTLIKLS